MNNHINYFDITTRLKKINDVSKFFTPNEAFALGNVDKDIYDEYKTYKPRPIIFNDSANGIKRMIQAYYFTINDLTLYLDIHPEDKEVFEYLKQLTRKLNELMTLYNKNQDQLFIFSDEQNQFNWYKMWPWEGRMK